MKKYPGEQPHTKMQRETPYIGPAGPESALAKRYTKKVVKKVGAGRQLTYSKSEPPYKPFWMRPERRSGRIGNSSRRSFHLRVFSNFDKRTLKWKFCQHVGTRLTRRRLERMRS